MFEKELQAFRTYLIRKRYREETYKSYIINVNQFLKLINKKSENINQRDLAKYEEFCVKYQNSSLVNKYASVNKYLEFLIDEGILKDKYLCNTDSKKWKLKSPKPQPKIVRPLSRNIVQKIFEASKKDPLMHTIFKTAYYGISPLRSIP
jgi:site-specific recombinase XerD